LYKRVSVGLAIMFLFAGGCTDRHKTKEAFFNEGMTQLEAKNPGSAIIFFKNALERDQNYFDARFQLARAYSVIGKYDAAERELQKVLRQRPASREAHIEIARVYAQGGKPDEALKEIAALAGDVKKDDIESLEISGWAYTVKGDYPTAAVLFKKVLVIQPGRPSAMLMSSKTYLLAGNIQAAHAQVDELLKNEPSNRSALYLLAEIQTRERDASSAIKTYDLLLHIVPTDSEALFKKGMLYVEQGRFDDAIAISETLIRKFSALPEGYKLKGIGLFSQKNFKDAIVMFQKTVAIRPNTGVYYLLGLCHFNNGELEQAMDQLQRALDLNPAYDQARVLASLVYMKKSKADDAITEIRKVLAADPKNAAAHSILGSAFLAKGMSAEGLAELNRALELDPEFVDARLKKGIFELSRGKTGEGEAELGAAVRINPELLNGRIILASSYLRRNEYAKALTTAQQGLRGQKTDAFFYNIIADVSLHQSKPTDAMNALRKAKEADPRYEVTYFKLVALHMMAGEQEKGISELQTLVGLSPDNAQAWLALASLLEISGKGKEARTCYESARKTGQYDAALETARYYLRCKEPAEAVTALDEVLRINPSAPDLLGLKGRALLDQKKFEEAVDTYEKLAQVNAGTGLAAVVDAYLAMNKLEKALERVRREMKGNPERLDLMAEVSRIYAITGKTTEAVDNARQIIRKQPGAAIGYVTLAMVYQSCKDIDKGIDVLKSAPKMQDVNLPMMLGNLYAIKKNFASALEQYRKAELLRPGYVPAIYQKGVLFYTMGKKKEAIAEYQRVVQLFQEHVPALNNLAYLYAEDRGSLSAALQYAVQAYVLAPQDGSVQDTLGYVLVKNGKVEEGLKVLAQAAATVRDNPSVYYHLALAYNEHREKGAAVKYLQKALGLGDFPEQHQAATLLSQLNGGTRVTAR
jgi:putative PEP-CTERM system TPR-repeat lipoprotein